MPEAWREALLRLHARGWDTDDIEPACEALNEAAEAGRSLDEFSPRRVSEILGSPTATDDCAALLAIAAVHQSDDEQGIALREALYDLDAFAYEFAGDD